MKSGRSLMALAKELTRQQHAKRDLIVPSLLMHHETGGDGETALIVEEEDTLRRYAVTDLARRQLADKLNIPFKYFERMRTDEPDLLDRNVNTWLQKEGDDKRMLRTLDGHVRAVLSDRYRRLDNFALAEHILPILQQLDGAFQSVELTASRMYLKFVLPRLDYELEKPCRPDGERSHRRDRGLCFLESLDLIGKVNFLPQKNLYHLVTDHGNIIVGHGGVEAYKKQLTDIFPAEAENIDRLIKEASRMYNDSRKLFHLRLPYWLRIALVPFFMRRLMRYEKYTVNEFFKKFTNNKNLIELLGAQWPYYSTPPSKLAFEYFSYPFFDYLAHGGYSIEGGSQKLSDTLVDNIQALGSEVRLSTRVTRLLTDHNHVNGVEIRGSKQAITAKVVISNIAPHEIVKLAGPDNFPKVFHLKLAAARPSLSAFQVFLGLDCDVTELGVSRDEYSVFFSPSLDADASYNSVISNSFGVNNAAWFMNYFTNIDPSLAPSGKATVGLFTLLPGIKWTELDKNEYRVAKENITNWLLDKAEAHLPGIKKHAIVVVGASPRTMAKYTANTAGCYNGFEQNVKQSGFKRFSMTYPIKNLYQVGSWTFPGGGVFRRFVVRLFPRHSLFPWQFPQEISPIKIWKTSA
jgi:prolycopene isomerase